MDNLRYEPTREEAGRLALLERLKKNRSKNITLATIERMREEVDAKK
jgi:hypothetical protein